MNRIEFSEDDVHKVLIPERKKIGEVTKQKEQLNKKSNGQNQFHGKK